MSGVLPIITADRRLAVPRGIKGYIFGGSGIGKTSLLRTLDSASTPFMDLEASDLAIEGWQGDTIRPRTWIDCQDFEPARTVKPGTLKIELVSQEVDQ
jgi:predicted ATPase